MQERATEGLYHASCGIDSLPYSDIARHLHAAQMAALAVVDDAIDDLSKAATLMTRTLREDGNLIYAAAGSSGLMAAADALELPGTFGIDPGQIRILMAGGMPTGSEMPGDTEDDSQSARNAARSFTARDTIIAVSASGSTPYAVALARAAKDAGAATICIANNPDADLFEHATVAICLPTPPEVVAGSTRMGAATAQKVALNIMSTLMGVGLGHVHDGMMVNLRADNAKLRQRAASVVAQIAAIPEPQAAECLSIAGGAVKPAILLASGAPSLAAADGILEQTQGHLRAALAQLNKQS